MQAKKPKGSRKLLPFSNSFMPLTADCAPTKYVSYFWHIGLETRAIVPQARKLIKAALSFNPDQEQELSLRYRSGKKRSWS